jgi:hypothetical protein
MFDVRRDIPQSGKMLTLVLGLAFVAAVVWLLSNTIVAEGFRGVLLLVACLAAASVAGMTLSNWRSGVYLFFAWLLFEDFVRKYLGNSMYVYFGKDVLIGFTYAAFLMARLRGDTAERFKPPFKWALGMFFLLGLAQVFNPGSPSLWYGVLGLKLYFYYIPLMFVGYSLLRTERDLRPLIVINMGLAAIISLVGILQSIVGIDFLNPHGGTDIDALSHEVRMTRSGIEIARPPSVFVSEGRSFDFLALAFPLGMGAAGYLLLRSRAGRKIVFPALALIAVATVLSGSRSGFVYLIASGLSLSAGMLWGAPPKLGEGYRLVKAIRRSFVFVALALSLAVVIFPQVIGARLAFYHETIALDSPDSETANRVWTYPVTELGKALSDPDRILGHGIGTTSLGGQYVSRIMQVPSTRFVVESGYGSLILEMGILGLVLWLAWTSILVIEAFKTLLKLKGTWAFPLALSIFWFTIYLLFARTFQGIVAYQDFVLNAYLWLLIGILFRLPGLVAQDSNSEVGTRGSLRG